MGAVEDAAGRARPGRSAIIDYTYINSFESFLEHKLEPWQKELLADYAYAEFARPDLRAAFVALDIQHLLVIPPDGPDYYKSWKWRLNEERLRHYIEEWAAEADRENGILRGRVL